jgi:hypothetical protein
MSLRGTDTFLWGDVFAGTDTFGDGWTLLGTDAFVGTDTFGDGWTLLGTDAFVGDGHPLDHEVKKMSVPRITSPDTYAGYL